MQKNKKQKQLNLFPKKELKIFKRKVNINLSEVQPAILPTFTTMVFFMHMILMDSKNQLAMNLGETYLITENSNERLGKQKIDLVVL